MSQGPSKISDMTQVAVDDAPASALVPFVVQSATGDFSPSANYITDIIAGLLARPTSVQLAANSGASLIGFTQGGTGSVDTTLQAKARQILNAADKGFSTGATAAVNATAIGNCISDLSGGGTLNIGPGTFALDNVTTAQSDLTIVGAGRDATIITQGTTPGNSYGILHFQSGSDSTYVENLTIRDLTLKNTAGTFSEHIHLLSMAGVRNAVIERVNFVGFRGDGVYLAGCDLPLILGLRHNVNVTFRDCLFDGVNNQNRNAFTGNDCDGLTIENCVFRNCTKSTMPGAIDFEPDFAGSIVKNVRIIGNDFSGVGGNVGIIAVVVSSTITAVPTNFIIEGNVSSGYVGSNAAISFSTGRLPTATSTENHVRIRDNVFSGGAVPFNLFDGKDVQFSGNLWSDFTGTAAVGFTGATDNFRDVVIGDDRFVRCGSAGAGIGLAVFTGDYLVFSGTQFIDCGTGGVGTSIAIDFNAGTTTLVTFDNVTFSSPSGKTAVAIKKEASHTFTPATNRFIDCVLNGLTNVFVWTAPGQVLTPATATYDPGSLATGASTSIQTITVTGAALRDSVSTTFSLDLAGATISSWVSASNTVSYFFTNTNGTNPLDLASGTVTATVTKAG